MPTTPPDYASLAAFVAVAEETSFSKAARRLGITKGTVSRAIARLEETVGAELVHRDTHRVALSTAGTALYERTAPHLAALAGAVGTLPERSEQPSGELRVTAPHDFAAIVLPALVAQFVLRYPEVSVDLRVTNARVDLIAEGFDLAIRAVPEKLADSRLTARRLGIGAMGFYASPSYLARRGLPGFVTSADVAQGLLQAVLPGHTIGTASLMLVYPSSGQVPRKVTAFRDFMVERLKARPLAA
jgi:DNA-binding transcriptional LysR family regulator